MIVHHVGTAMKWAKHINSRPSHFKHLTAVRTVSPWRTFAIHWCFWRLCRLLYAHFTDNISQNIGQSDDTKESAFSSSFPLFLLEKEMCVYSHSQKPCPTHFRRAAKSEKDEKSRKLVSKKKIWHSTYHCHTSFSYPKPHLFKSAFTLLCL